MTFAEILVVEDDGPTRELLSLSLELEGYTVALASNGIEGWRRLQAGPPPSVVLLDIMMPGMDGLELLSRMRGQPALARLPVIVVSAFGPRERGEIRLANEFLQKPFDVDALLAAIARYCPRHAPGPEPATA